MSGRRYGAKDPSTIDAPGGGCGDPRCRIAAAQRAETRLAYEAAMKLAAQTLDHVSYNASRDDLLRCEAALAALRAVGVEP